MIDPIKKIDDLMKEHNWSDYKLSVESGLSTSTIANNHRRNTIPSSAFGITLSQFFQEDGRFVELSDEQLVFFKKWSTLTASQKKLVMGLIEELK